MPSSTLVRLRTFALALLLCVIGFELLVLAYGESPRAIATLLFTGTWGTGYGVGQVLGKSTSIAFAALAAHFALRAGLFHLGIEAAITLAALTVGAVGARLPANSSAAFAIGALICIASLTGAFTALPVAVLRAKFGAHEVLSGMMTNKLGSLLVSYGLAKGLAERASVHTPALITNARLPRLSQIPGLSALYGSSVDVSIVLLAITGAGLSWLLNRTRFGKRLDAIAASPSVAHASGISVSRHMFVVLCGSSGLAALAATHDVLGVKGYAEEGFGQGVGFVGLSAALLGGRSIIGVLLASVLLGTLAAGGLAVNARIPMEIVDVVSAMTVLVVAVAPGLSHRLTQTTFAARTQNSSSSPPANS